MAFSAIPKNRAALDAPYILSEPYAAGDLPNATPMSTLPEDVAEAADIIMVQKGGLGGDLNGVPVDTIRGTPNWELISANTQMEVNVDYLCSGAGPYEMTLPVLATSGRANIRVAAPFGTFVIKQNADQEIVFNTSTTTAGTGGSITSTAAGQCIELLCIADDDNWMVLNSQGTTFTIV